MLLPVRQKTITVPGGRLVRVGTASPRGLGSSMPMPALDPTSATKVPTVIARKLEAKKLHGGDRPYDMQWGPPITYVQIPPGEKGTVATLKIMKKLALGSWGHRNPEVVMLAQQIVNHLPSKDYRGEADAILQFMKRHVRYRYDPAGLEYVSTPWYTLLVSGNEDCDGHATAIAALAMALGHRAAFRTVKGDPGRPDAWSHVYPVIGIVESGKTVWLTADSTQKESYLGWDPPEGKLFGMKTWVIDPSLSEGSEWDT